MYGVLESNTVVAITSYHTVQHVRLPDRTYTNLHNFYIAQDYDRLD